MTGNEIREMFLRYFEGKGHRRVRSSSLVPVNDPTLLFTNAGMNQFKDVFLGLEQRDYKRATSCQKCVRAGGKHNDLESVGFTNRHHTFFEMLGNFSFGDYFKKDAIAFAWELVTSKNWFNIDPKKLHATIFKGEEGIPRDDEAYDHWLSQGVPKDRIFESGMEENFWQMGDTGPCGPCSEIHYDMGPATSDQGHADCKFPCDCGRYVEIWNLVFMQFNRDASGALTPLPKPCVDTGMGLERVAAVLQNKISNYETDLFTPLIEAAGTHVQLERAGGDAATGQLSRRPSHEQIETSFRIIADHARATTFLISDGVIPSNEGRGYVLRKIIRRAIRHGRLLGASDPFLFKMAHAVRLLMGDAYPELRKPAFAQLLGIVLTEETRFGRTLDLGLKKLEAHLKHWSPKALERSRSLATESPVSGPYESGIEAFALYDTYGLPRDFIEDAYRDAGIPFPADGFEQAMAEQRARARASWKGGAKEAANPAYAKLAETYKTEPDFYFGTDTKDCHIEAIVTKHGQVNEIKEGQEAEVVLDRTVIYAESGGQVADTGAFYDNSESLEVAEVRGAYYPVTGLIAHKILAKETLRVGDRVAVIADAPRREHIKRNHTGTHLVHAALRNILGTHVKQAGSLNAPDRLRFDFSHFAAVDLEELRDIEQQVNDHILQNVEMQTDVTSLDDALASGALAFFGDKYPEQNVRVVTIPDPASPLGFYSKELCGGTHVKRTGDIGVFKIISEQSIAAGVRRIEAITGDTAMERFRKVEALTQGFRNKIRVEEETEASLTTFAARLIDFYEKQIDQQFKQVQEARKKIAIEALAAGSSNVRLVKGVKVLVSEVDNLGREQLREVIDTLRQKLGSGVVVLGTVQDGKAALLVGVTKDLTNRLDAGKLAQSLAEKLGGKGGGRPDLGEAGGKDTSALNSTLGLVPSLVEQML